MRTAPIDAVIGRMDHAMMLCAAFVAAAILLGGKMPDARAAEFAYIGNAASNTVTVMALDIGSGALTEVQTVELGGGAGGSTPMAVSPDKRLLFVGQRSEPFRVTTFSIDQASGKLTPVGQGPLAASMAALEIDRAGKLLFAASYPGHLLSVSPIGADGVVGATSQVISDIANAHSIKPDDANRFVLAASLGSDSLRVFRLEASGTLTPNDPDRAQLPARSGPRHFTFDSSGARLYLLAELSGEIFVFDYDKATGRLTRKQQVSLHAPDAPPPANDTWWAADIHLTPDGRFIYASVRSNSTLAGFAVAAESGLLTPVDIYPTEAVPRGFAIDPGGRFLLAAGEQSGHVQVYGIGTGGQLTPLGRYRVGDSPNWIEILELS